MRNNITLIIALLILGIPSSWAQNFGELNIGDVRARFNANGLISEDPAAGGANFEVPLGTNGANTLYAGGLWVKGITSDNQVRVAAMMYEALGEGDYYTGPLSIDGSASTSAAMMDTYNTVWSVTRSEIETHLSYFSCLADPNCEVLVEFPNGYTIPASILEWPAMNGETGFSPYQAPFFDFNEDGNYVPADGDAPCILGDQALYFVFNDKGGPHMLTGSPPIGLEIQAMPFAYDSGDPALDQTVFVRYHLINRGTLTLEGTRIGVFNDFDLGCPDDDYAGTDAARNLTYVYNGDAQDEDCVGVTGYGSNPPATGMVLLKGPLVDATGTDEAQIAMQPAWNGTGFGDGIADNERSGISKAMTTYRDGPTWGTEPVSTMDYVSYLSGFWKDGAQLTYGADGHEPGVATDHIFPGSSDPLGVGTGGVPQSPWFEGGLPPFDRRTISSTAPFLLEPGEHLDLLFAYVYARATGGPLSSVTALQARVDSVTAFALTLPIWDIAEESALSGGCEDYAVFLGVEEPRTSGTLSLFPSPATVEASFVAPAALVGGTIQLRDAVGRPVAAQRIVLGRNTIDISALANGVYTCEAVTSRARFTGKLVKQ